jgi:hypothetical protein
MFASVGSPIAERGETKNRDLETNTLNDKEFQSQVPSANDHPVLPGRIFTRLRWDLASRSV